MARPHIPEEGAAYYPPRARWYSVFFYLGNSLRRRMALDRLTLPRDTKIGEMIAGFFLCLAWRSGCAGHGCGAGRRWPEVRC
jgi:hypothetical protein